MFGEKIEEMGLPVVQLPKYKESRAAALKLIDEKGYITEGDFWILMNKTKKKDKMLYSGLIISHNGCLKINDNAPEKNKFKPECVTVDINGYQNSLVYTYCSPEQGIYEVGEVSKDNCQNAYPYAMAYKRCFDRVVLKLCKLAFYGIYSDSEADEFRAPEMPEKKVDEQDTDSDFGAQFRALTEETVNNLKEYFSGELTCQECGRQITDIITSDGIISATEAARRSENQYGERLCVKCAKAKKKAKEEK